MFYSTTVKTTTNSTWREIKNVRDKPLGAELPSFVWEIVVGLAGGAKVPFLLTVYGKKKAREVVPRVLLMTVL